MNQVHTYQTVEVVEALEKIYAFVLVPWESIGVRELHPLHIVLRQCDHTGITAELLPELLGRCSVLVRVFCLRIDLYRYVSLEASCTVIRTWVL